MQGENAELATVAGNRQRFSRVSSLVSSNGGADGVRTHDLLDAIEARSQLRHGPTERFKFTTGLCGSKALLQPKWHPCNPGPALQVLWSESKLIAESIRPI